MAEIASTCPKCGNSLLEIVYGMVDPETMENPAVIVGGCDFDPNAPVRGCRSCGFRGYPGGRTYKTSFTVNGHAVNLLEFTDIEVWLLAETNFKARLELLHRGVSEREIFQQVLENEDWLLLPFEPFAQVYVHVDDETGKPLLASWFYAHEEVLLYSYLMPGGNRWQEPISRQDFYDVVLPLKRPSLSVWLVKANDDSPDIFDPEVLPVDFGSQAVRAVIDNTSPTFSAADKRMERPILWPSWFTLPEAFRF